MAKTAVNKYRTPEQAVDRFRRDVEFIEAWSKMHKDESDMLLDIGLLTHIYVKRRWVGPYQDWTDVAVYWMADRSKMSKPRLKASLDRLEAWGMVARMTSNTQVYKAALKYMYVNRTHANDVTMYGKFMKDDVPYGEDETPEVCDDDNEEQEEVAEAKPVRQEARRTPVATPPVKYPIYSPMPENSFLYTDTVWGQYQVNLVSKDIYDATPTCSACGRKVTYFKSGEVCRDCWTADWIRNTMRNGGFPITVTEEVLKNKRTHPAATLNTVALARQWLAAYQQGLDSKT